MARTDGRSVLVECWLFDRLVRDAYEVASSAGSLSGAGHSVATVAVVEALGLLPADVSAGHPELVSLFRREPLSAELVEAVGELIERSSWAEHEARAEEYYRKVPASRPPADRYAYRRRRVDVSAR